MMSQGQIPLLLFQAMFTIETPEAYYEVWRTTQLITGNREKNITESVSMNGKKHLRVRLAVKGMEAPRVCADKFVLTNNQFQQIVHHDCQVATTLLLLTTMPSWHSGNNDISKLYA